MDAGLLQKAIKVSYRFTVTKRGMNFENSFLLDKYSLKMKSTRSFEIFNVSAVMYHLQIHFMVCQYHFVYCFSVFQCHPFFMATGCSESLDTETTVTCELTIGFS